MNKIYLAVSLCVLVATTNAYAAPADSFYAGISVGTSEIEDEDVLDFKDTTFKVFGGYQFNSLIAIEGYYTKFDDTQSLSGLDANLEAKVLGVSAKFTPIRGSKIVPFGKIGVNKLDSKAKLNGIGIGDEGDTKLSLGIGVEMQVAKNISLRAEYEKYNSDFTMFSAGVAINY